MVSTKIVSSPSSKPSILSRRLLSVTTALRICGFCEPDPRQLILLSRYVAGNVALKEILPALTQS